MTTDALGIELAARGCCWLRRAADAQQVAEFASEIEQRMQLDVNGVLSSRGVAYGIRNLLQIWPGVSALAYLPQARKVIQQALGEDAGIVRALFFDKPPSRSWTLPWHRDRTIAVRKLPSKLGEFSHPTIKAGIAHLTAPQWLLENMLTLRLSIDPMNDENGPVVILPGSHATAAGDEDLCPPPAASAIETIHGEAGDIFVMRPLLAQSSLLSSPTNRLRRRVVHLEICNQRKLPDEIQWCDYLPING